MDVIHVVINEGQKILHLPLFGGVGLQTVNGSPTYPVIQEHVGTCIMTEQVALIPHEPGHGS